MQVRRSTKPRSSRAPRALLAKVALAEKADAYPPFASPRAAAACRRSRALAMEPKLMRFDEGRPPLLDPELVR